MRFLMIERLTLRFEPHKMVIKNMHHLGSINEYFVM